MKVETQITEYDNDNKEYIIDITAEYYEYEKGSRDSFGVPLEPDYGAYFVIEDIMINGKNHSLSEIALLLDYSVDYVNDIIQEALSDKIESDLYSYYDNQIDDYYENNYY